MASADDIYVVLADQQRLSRYFIAEWFIRQCVQPPQLRPQSHSSQIWSQVKVISSSAQSDSGSHPVVSASSPVYFLPSSHAFVFLLDLSCSQRTVDTVTSSVLLDDVFFAFGSCLRALVQPFCVPGCDVVYTPKLQVTVLAHIPSRNLNTRKPLQVLVQGKTFSSNMVESFLLDIQSQLFRLETEMYHDEVTVTSDQTASIDFGLLDMIHSCTLALQLLSSAASGVVIVSDGVCEFLDVNTADTLLYQLRSFDIACSFLKVGDEFHPQASYGFVSNTHLLRFIAEASGGAHLTVNCLNFEDVFYDPDEGDVVNLYQKLMLCRTIQAVSPNWTARQRSHWSLFEGQLCLPTLMRKRYSEEKIQSDIMRYLGSRVREGFQIRDVFLSKKDTQLEVKIVMPWKEEVKLEYHVVGPWPLNQVENTIQVSLVVEAGYDFLVDISAKKAAGSSPFRSAVVKCFLQTVRNFQRSDQLMIHLSSFSTVSAHHSVPQSAQDGLPLFYVQPGSSTPVLSQDVASPSKEKGRKPKMRDPVSQFATFWRPVISLDTSIWYKWFHIHRIAVQLDYDAPLPKHLHVPNASGRFSTAQCRKAAGSLYSALTDWSTFVLLENHSYIRFITSNSESESSPPSHFCLARLTQKSPHMVVRIAFVAGTPPDIQFEMVEGLRGMLNTLVVERQTPRMPKMSVTMKGRQKKLVSQETIIQTPAFVMTKVPERIFVRYEKLPAELTHSQEQAAVRGTFGNEDALVGIGEKTSVGSGSTLVMRSLENYLYHIRWVWRLHPDETDQESSFLSVTTVGLILSALLRLRLREGFHIASSALGLVYLVKELQMKETDDLTQPCLLQYVLFPPLACGSSGTSEQSHSGAAVLKAKKLHIVTEAWIEPQCGSITNCSPSMRGWEGLDYQQILDEVHRSSTSLVSTLCSYEQLFLMCCHPGLCPPPTRQCSDGRPNGNVSLQHVPFLFDVCLLLRQTRQLQLLFSGFGKGQSSQANARLLSLICEKLVGVCETKFLIQDADAVRLTEQIWLRCPEEDRQHDRLKWLLGVCRWNCFLKPAGESRLFVVLVPDSSTYCKSVSSESDDETDTAIPVYIYECHQWMESEKKDKKVTGATEVTALDADVVEDLTFLRQNHEVRFDASETDQDSCVRYHGASRRVTRTSRNSSTAVFVNTVSTQLATFRERVKDVYYQCFVEATFVALRNREYVDTASVTDAVELCEEGRIGIDLTDFLSTICVHFSGIDGQLKRSGSDLATPVLEKAASVENDGDLLAGRSSICGHPLPICRVFGNMIEAQFSSILASSFQAVPASREVFFFSPYGTSWESSSQSSDSPQDTLGQSLTDCSDNGDVDFTDMGQRSESRADSEGFEEVFTQEAAEEDVEVAFLGYSSGSKADKDEEGEEEDSESNDLPLFISFICSVKDKKTGHIHVTAPLTSIPTCLGRIVEQLDNDDANTRSMPLDHSNLDVSVTLDITLFTLPQQDTYALDIPHLDLESTDEVLPSSPRERRYERRLAFRPFSPTLSDHSDEDEVVLNPLGHLSISHHRAVENLRKQIVWLMSDEIIAAARTTVPITSATLEKVVCHIQSSQVKSCQSVRVPLLFVYGVEQSMRRFIQEFESMFITSYNLNKVENYYYLSEDRPLLRHSHMKTGSLYSSLEGLDHQTRGSRRGSVDLSHKVHMDSLQLPSTYASQASLGGISLDSVTTYDAATGEGSEDDSSMPYLTRMLQEAEGHAIAACSDLWLILKVSPQHVDLYFHSRYSETSSANEDRQRCLLEQVETEVKSKCRLVNQAMLLTSLLEKRVCHHLLLSESKEDTWAQGSLVFSSSPLSFNYTSLSFEQNAINSLPPGHFECSLQHTCHIPLHWRVAATAAGLQAAHAALVPFMVINRKNMYVYQEQGGSENIFYIRLSESMCVTEYLGPSNRKSLRSQSSMEVRSASSMSVRGASEYGDDWSTAGAFNNRTLTEPNNESKLDKSVAVEVFGITKPGPDITVELVGILQKKIENTLLSCLTNVISRNPNSKLDTADIQFIQPLGMAPTTEFSYIVSNLIPLDQRALLYYLQQHLLQFLVAPNYQTLSSESQFRHSQTLGEEPETLLPYDCVFLYCRSPIESAAGLACVYAQCTGFVFSGLDEAESTFDIRDHSIAVLTAVFESELDASRVCDPAVQFQLWVRGDVGLSNLKKKLMKSVEHALCDYLLEYFVLVMPLTPIPCVDLDPDKTVDAEEVDTDKYHEWAIVTVSHPTPERSQSLTLTRNRGAEIVYVQPGESPCLAFDLGGKSDLDAKAEVFMTQSCGSDKDDCRVDDRPETPEPHAPPQSQAIDTPTKKRHQHTLPSARRLKRMISGQNSGQAPVVSPGVSSCFSLPKDVKFALHSAFVEYSRTSSLEESPQKSKISKEVPGWLAKEIQRRESERLRELLEKAAVGDTGSLMSAFHKKGICLMDHACEIQSPTTHCYKLSLLSRYAVDYLLKEIERAIPTFFPEISPCTFCLENCDQTYRPYKTRRKSLESTRDGETSCDGLHVTKMPLGDQSFIITGRKLDDWQYTVESMASGIHSNKKAGQGASKQSIKFMPFDVHTATGKPPGQHTFLEQDQFIPRQKFFLFHIRDKQIIFYTYNYPPELNNRIDRFLSRLSEWQNARSRFLDFVLGQKMGLFHHFRTVTSRGSRENAAAVLKRNSSDLDQLVQETVPPTKESLQRERGSLYSVVSKSTTPQSSRAASSSRGATSPSGRGQSASSGSTSNRTNSSTLDDFDGLYRETFPRIPMHYSLYSSHSDPVHRHCKQALDLKAYQRKMDNRAIQLADILDTWQGRSKQKIAISMELLVVLKQTARLIHYCNSPLLLSRKWRKTLIETSYQREAINIDLSVDDFTAAAQAGGSRDVKSVDSEAGSGFDGEEEDYWHQCVRFAFLNDYVTYLEQQLGFLVIDVKQGGSLFRSSSVDSGKETSPSPFVVSANSNSTHTGLLGSKCLQKTLAGGLILMELSFQDSYFSVRLYALEASRIRRDVVLNTQMSKLFTDECSHLKDLTHVHSFAYDFHLRQIHNLLSTQPGVQSLLPSGYPLMDFLDDFNTLCVNPPTYIRNRLLTDDIAMSIPVTASPDDLFRYLLVNSTAYGLKTLETSINQFSAAASPCEPVWTMAAGDKCVLMKASDDVSLSKKKGVQSRFFPSDMEFHSYLLICQKSKGLEMVSLDSTELQGSSYEMHLRFYLVLISRHHIFPRLTLTSPRGWRQSIVKFIRSSSLSRKEETGPTSSSPAGRSLKTANNLVDGADNEDDEEDDEDEDSFTRDLTISPAPVLDPAAIKEQVNAAKQLLGDAIRSATRHFRRDSLWKRLLFGYADPGSVKKDQTSSRGSSQDKSSSQIDETVITRLTFEEFDELLCLVSPVSLDSMDKRLAPFLQMNREWYHGLVSGLTVRFGEQVRTFKKPDGTMFHLIVFSPEFHDAFVLLTLHATGSRNKAEFTVVYKKTSDQSSQSAQDVETVSDQELACRGLIENVVNFTCYYVWTLLTK